MQTTVSIRKEIERLGFRVVATSSWHNEDGKLIGVRYEAHRIVGKRVLVKGEQQPTPKAAILSLLTKCQEKLV